MNSPKITLNVIPPNCAIPEDIQLQHEDVMRITIKLHGAVEATHQYEHTASEVGLLISFAHFHVEYPEGYTGAEVIFS